MISTNYYDISIVIDPEDNMFGQRLGVVYSGFTGKKLGTVNYNRILETGQPEEVDDYINSNMNY